MFISSMFIIVVFRRRRCPSLPLLIVVIVLVRPVKQKDFAEAFQNGSHGWQPIQLSSAVSPSVDRVLILYHNACFVLFWLDGISTSTLDRRWRQATVCSFCQKQLIAMHHLIITVQSAPSHVHRTNLQRCVDVSALVFATRPITYLEMHQPISTCRYARRHCFNPTFILEQCQRL